MKLNQHVDFHVHRMGQDHEDVHHVDVDYVDYVEIHVDDYVQEVACHLETVVVSWWSL